MKFLRVKYSRLAGIAFLALSILFFSRCSKLGVGGPSYNIDAVATATQVVPASTSAATSSMTASLDGHSNTLTGTIRWSGLSGAPTLIHLHSAAPGRNGYPMFLLVNVPKIATDSMTFTSVFTESQEGTLAKGGYYYDIHTAAFPNGEIRGQMIPQ
jgi:hypothetical protein